MGKTRIESKREAENTRKVFDEVQKCDADSVDSIEVDVERIDVRFHHWTSQIITVKFCGEADIASGDVEFDAYILRNRLYVETKVKGIVETSDLKLDIWLPGNIFDEIRVNGNSAQVEINSGVVARLVRVETLSGNIDIRAIFIKAIVKSAFMQEHIKATVHVLETGGVSGVDPTTVQRMIDDQKKRVNVEQITPAELDMVMPDLVLISDILDGTRPYSSLK